MSKIADKWQITEVKSVMVDGVNKVDLSHNNGKVEWYITVKGEFYTEFTFDSYDAANGVYNLLVNCTNIFMDSLLVSTPNNKWVMSDAEIVAYEEGS